MTRVAVFVDAGYLFAQGSVALTGSKKPRHQLDLNQGVVVNDLRKFAQEKTNDGKLLRIYWYDATRTTALQEDHEKLAYTDHVKLRLGLMNSRGQQKGVDSLIVTDLIELARHRVIDDAILMSGDEDVRIGV